MEEILELLKKASDKLNVEVAVTISDDGSGEIVEYMQDFIIKSFDTIDELKEKLILISK